MCRRLFLSFVFVCLGIGVFAGAEPSLADPSPSKFSEKQYDLSGLTVTMQTQRVHASQIAEGRFDMGRMRMGGLGETPVQFFGGYRKYSHTDSLSTPQLRSDGLARAGVLFSF